MIAFPASPADGQTFIAPNGAKYFYTAAQKTWKCIAGPTASTFLPSLIITGSQIQILPMHSGRSLSFYDMTDGTLLLPATYSPGFNFTARRWKIGNVYWAPQGNASIIPVFQGHTQIGIPSTGALAYFFVEANSDGQSAVWSVAGQTS